MFGRHGEAPVPIVAPSTPGDCFFAAIEAARIALKYRTPVFLLSDGYLANGAEPWQVPDVAVPARHQRALRHRAQPRQRGRRTGVLALPPGPRDPGPALGHPRHPGPHPSHRRPGEGGRLGRRLLRPGQPRADDQAPGGQGGRHRRRHPPRRGRRPGRRRGAASSAGAPPTDPSRPASGGSGRRATRWPTPTCATSTRSPRTSARWCARYRKVLVPEMNLGSAGQAGPGRLPRRRPQSHQRRGEALPGARRSSRPSSTCSSTASDATKASYQHDRRCRAGHHQEGLDQRSGDPVVPRLRGLLDPDGGPDAHARARAPAGKTPCSCRASAAAPASRIT